MKVKILLTVLMVTMISLTINTGANAHPWHYRAGWHRPHAAILVPPVPIPVPAPSVVVNRGYYGPRYYGSHYDRCYGNRYNDRVYYNNGYYGRSYCAPRRGYRERDRYDGDRYEHNEGRYSRHYRR